MKIHPSITEDMILAAAEESMVGMSDGGFCNACGNEVTYGVEPDARDYECEACGERAVHGACEYLLELELGL